MNKVAFCTIASANYFAFAKTLLRSLERTHPECDRYFLLVDKQNDRIAAEQGFTTLSPGELGIEGFEQMSFAYDIVELNTAVKPFLLTSLLKKGYRKVIYLDPDILVVNRLDRVLKLLDTASIVVTPHSVHPAPPATSFLSQIEHEKNMSTTGIFNLGFVGISRTRDAEEFLAWWRNRCRYLCFVDPTAGIFVDQKWAELAVAYWDRVHILRDPGYNVSVWNLHGRALSRNKVNKKWPLVFYHFSSIEIRDDAIFSKNERYVRPEDYPEVKELFSRYRKEVVVNGFDEFSRIPYGFGFFSDGKKIDLLERRLFAMVAEQFKNPFGCTRKEFHKEVKKNAARLELQTKGAAFAALGVFSRLLFRLIGPRNYRNLATYLGKSSQLRAHTFLLQ